VKRPPEDRRQLAVWIATDLKLRLESQAAAEKRPQAELVRQALEALLMSRPVATQK